MKNILLIFFLFLCRLSFGQYLNTDGSNSMTGALNIITSGYSSIELKSSTGSFIDFHSNSSGDYGGRIIWNYDSSNRFDIYGTANFRNHLTATGNITGNSIIPKVTLGLPAIATGANNNYFKQGTGDGGTPITYNTFLRLHFGMAIGSPFVSDGNGGYEEKATISFCGRTGNIFTLGKIGIGTTATGSHKLAVDGSIGAREIRVEANGWSDFVFEDNYELKSLEETEQFIIENKHLPDMPNESEVLNNGINLGEMDTKLLQKIEELTLHLIEQNKEIKNLKEEMQKLKAEKK